MNTNTYIKIYYKYKRKQLWQTVYCCFCVTLLSAPLLLLFYFYHVWLLFWPVMICACLLILGFIFLCVVDEMSALIESRGKAGVAKLYYRKAKEKAEEIRELYSNTHEGKLGKPDIKITYNRDLMMRQYEVFLFPWLNKTGTYDTECAIYDRFTDEQRLSIESDLVDFQTWEMTQLKGNEYILVYKTKGLIVLNGRVFSIKDFCDYVVYDPISRSSHVVYESHAVVDEEATNRRMAAAHMIAGMKGVYLSSLLPSPTVTTTSARVVESATGSPKICFIMKNAGTITYPYSDFSQSKEVVVSLLEYLNRKKKY